MSEENVEHVRQDYDAFNRGDADFVARRLSDDFELKFHHPQIPGMEPAYRGVPGFRKFVEDWIGIWESLQSDVERIIDVDDERVLGLITMRGTARGGMKVENEYAHLITIRDGLEIRVDGFATWADAVRAAGLDPADHLGAK